MPLSSKRRAELRAEANGLTASVHVGQEGVTKQLVRSLDDVLRTHELVKVQVGKQLELTAKEAATSLAARARAEVVQVIGRTVTLYRENPDLPRKPGAPPAWRR